MNDTIRSTNYLEFKEFDRKISRLDEFCFSTVNVSDKLKSLSVIIKLIVVLGYGQESVGRGTSINKFMVSQICKIYY